MNEGCKRAIGQGLARGDVCGMIEGVKGVGGWDNQKILSKSPDLLRKFSIFPPFKLPFLLLLALFQEKVPF